MWLRSVWKGIGEEAALVGLRHSPLAAWNALIRTPADWGWENKEGDGPRRCYIHYKEQRGIVIFSPSLNEVLIASIEVSENQKLSYVPCCLAWRSWRGKYKKNSGNVFSRSSSVRVEGGEGGGARDLREVAFSRVLTRFKCLHTPIYEVFLFFYIAHLKFIYTLIYLGFYSVDIVSDSHPPFYEIHCTETHRDRL